MAQSQEQELTSLQESLGQCRTELKAANIKNSELKRALDEITLQLKKRVPHTHSSHSHAPSNFPYFSEWQFIIHTFRGKPENKTAIIRISAARITCIP